MIQTYIRAVKHISSAVAIKALNLAHLLTSLRPSVQYLKGVASVTATPRENVHLGSACPLCGPTPPRRHGYNWWYEGLTAYLKLSQQPIASTNSTLWSHKRGQAQQPIASKTQHYEATREDKLEDPVSPRHHAERREKRTAAIAKQCPKTTQRTQQQTTVYKKEVGRSKSQYSPRVHHT